MRIIKLVRQLLVKFDFFPATQFLRYKGQISYRTATGGVFTIFTVALFCILFANALIGILNKEAVTLSSDFKHEANPAGTNITFGPKGGFMIAISIGGMNLSRTDLNYFDITLSLNHFTPISQLTNSTPIPLQMCTQDHFSFNSDVSRSYVNLNGSNLLCPQLNYAAEVQGKVTSNVFKRLTITIKKCNSNLSSTCATEDMVKQLQSTLGYFGLGIVVINTELNPSLSENYSQFYLDDKNFFPFTTTLAIKANAHIEQYNIETDQSIFLISEIYKESGVRIPNFFQYSVIPVLSDTYAVIHLQKSSAVTTYSREFRKLDTLFAYVGGLIGTIFGVIFVLNSYNELSYELSLASKLCKYDDQEDIRSQKFNFLYYICYLVYKMVKNLFCCQNMPKMHILSESQEEIQKQLDVLLLMKRLIFFERFISEASPKLNINSQLLLSKSTLYEVKNYRHKYQDLSREQSSEEEDNQQKEDKQKKQNKEVNNQQQQVRNKAYKEVKRSIRNQLLNKQLNFSQQHIELNDNPINHRRYASQIFPSHLIH